MAKLKAGDLLTCQVCGLVVVVDEPCGCVESKIICCEDTPMVKGKTAAAKAKKNAAAKKETQISKEKPAAKKAPASKAPAKKKK